MKDKPRFSLKSDGPRFLGIKLIVFIVFIVYLTDNQSLFEALAKHGKSILDSVNAWIQSFTKNLTKHGSAADGVSTAGAIFIAFAWAGGKMLFTFRTEKEQKLIAELTRKEAAHAKELAKKDAEIAKLQKQIPGQVQGENTSPTPPEHSQNE